MPERVIKARVRRKAEEKAMEVAMEVMANPSISLLDQLKIEAQILHPVLEALRAELGKDRADELVAGAVRGWRREVIVRLGSMVPGTPREKFGIFMNANEQRIGEDVDFNWLRRDANVMDVDVTGCRYADLFHSLDEPALGAALACECDDHMADVVGPDLEYSRTQTIMKGASCCDFRFRMKDGES